MHSCHKPKIVEKYGDRGRLTFDYVCRNCNAGVLIRISELVFGSEWLNDLEKNFEARSELQKEIVLCSDDSFKIDINIIQYFLGHTSHKPVTFTEWIEGHVVGDISKWPNVSEADRTKIKDQQSRILFDLVDTRLQELVADFETRKRNSINPTRMIAMEVDDINDIVITGRYQFNGKPVPNEVVTIGSHSFRDLSMLHAVQGFYSDAVKGRFNVGVVPSPNQRVGVNALWDKTRCLVDAIAYERFLDHLHNNVGPSHNEHDGRSENNSSLKDLEGRIDDLRDLIITKFEESEDTHANILYTLQAGQEVIFNEFEDVKRLLPNLSKKNLKEIVKGKLYDLLVKRLLSKEMFDFIMEKLDATGPSILDNVKNFLR